MKKIALFLLAVMMVFSLSACAGEKEEEGTERIGSFQDSENETLTSQDIKPASGVESNEHPTGEVTDVSLTGSRSEGE